jgi:DNA recombination protein RmuC
MPDWIVPALLALILGVVLWLALRRSDTQPTERLERELRDEIGRQAQASRADLGSLQQVLLAQSGDVARTQNEQIDSFRLQLVATHQQSDASLRRLSDVLAEQLRLLSETNERRQAEMRQAVEVRLQSLQEGNEKKLEQMRATVDEKLQSTLEQRLGESFKLVADRLEQVHKGLGEMQGLARDVGSLNRVLNNVKTRGIVGEFQLAGLLEQVFTIEQYGAQVETVPGSGARVDFAIRLPGQRSDGVPMWLPIDAKFPREDYDRLLDAHERADLMAAEGAAKAIEARLRLEARSIREKYLAPPHTTDFAILFVPTEGLYAEALRRPGLVEAMQREHKVMLAGPTTLLATLTSLQMGFRTMALQQRSAEVWEVLGAVKTEFDKFGQALARVKSQTQSVLESIDKAQTRTRQMTRALKSVEAMPETHAQQLLLGALDEESIDTKGDAPSA